MKFWNFIRNETTGERELRLDGAISDETWLNARRAVELGFADKIIGGDSAGLTAQQFSRRQITNSFVTRFKREKNPADNGGVVVAGLRRRIFLGR